MTTSRIDDANGDAGLVLLAFIAEWNRRNSSGDTVWVGLPPLFEVASTRRKLFTGNDQPTQFMRRTVREACRQFSLRHAFASELEEELPYYLSIQLQYGFSLPHAKQQLWNWLRGHRPPEVAQRLLEPEGHYRSASFRRLVRDMKSYRRNYLPESDFRFTLRENPWVLPTWENELVTLIDGIPREGDEEESEFRLLSDPRVTWESEPEVWCRVCDLPDRLTAPRYVLRHNGRDLVRYYRHHSGAIDADCCSAQIPLDSPEVVVTLETPDSEVVEVQSIRLWEPESLAQVRPVDREAEEVVERLLPGEQVLITPPEAVVSPASPTWRVVGPPERRRRWWLLDGTEAVRVKDGGIVWNGEPPPSPPDWANRVSVSLKGVRNFFQLGERVQFRIRPPTGVEVNYATCANQPLSFADETRTCTSPVQVRAEMSGRCRIRVGVTNGWDSAVVHREVNLSVRAVVWADDGCEIPRNEPLSCFEAMSRPVRLLSDGPTVLIEGREIFGSFATGRATRIRRVLGTGRELFVADRPFNTHDRFRLSRSAVDTGIARRLELEGRRCCLRLFRPLQPSNRHRVFLWSPSHGVVTLGASDITTGDSDRTWAFPTRWETETLLVSIAYEGRCLGTAWCGQERQFFDPQATDGLDLIGRVSLIRWCRLPGLRPDPETRQYPLIGRLTRFPLEMARVALRDEGLPAGLGLEYEDRQSPRGELFNVIFREAYVQPTQGDVAPLFDGLPLDFNRLLTYHPLLSCRALQAVLPWMRSQSLPQTRLYLVAMRLKLLSLSSSAGSHDIAQRETEMLDRARITCCEDGELMDENAVREGLALPAMHHLFDGASLGGADEENLRTALGVAPFREYLAARILNRLLEQLT